MLTPGQKLLQDISLTQLEEMCSENPSLRGYLQGYISEMHLKTYLIGLDEVSFVAKIPDHHEDSGDFSVVYQGHTFKVEAKSVQTKNVREDILNGGWTGNVQVKKQPKKVHKDSDATTCSVPRGQFDVLAISTMSMTGSWSFKFIANKYLPTSLVYADRLATAFSINTLNTPKLTSNIIEVFEELKSGL